MFFKPQNSQVLKCKGMKLYQRISKTTSKATKIHTAFYLFTNRITSEQMGFQCQGLKAAPI